MIFCQLIDEIFQCYNILKVLPMLALNNTYSIRAIPSPRQVYVFIVLEIQQLVQNINHFYFKGNDTKCLKVQADIVKQLSNVVQPTVPLRESGNFISPTTYICGPDLPHVPPGCNQHYTFQSASIIRHQISYFEYIVTIIIITIIVIIIIFS